MKEILFDLDGTLWDPTVVVIKAWNEILGKYPEIQKLLDEEDLKRVLGLQIPQIGETLFPYLPIVQSHKIMDECCEHENHMILRQGGALFDHLEETLQHLSQKYPLFIISNCNSGYIEAFLSYHKLGKYFKDIECYGNTKQSKGENIKLLIKRNNLQDPVYVGDTQSDCDACKLANVPFVFADYGFGKARDFKIKINHVTELLELENKL